MKIDFDFDVDVFEKWFFINTQIKTRPIFNLEKSWRKFSRSVSIPKKGNGFRCISPAGGWSSCSVLLWLCDNKKVHNLYITTLRVGKKELAALTNLINLSKIKNVSIALSGVAKQNKVGSYSYNYQADFETACKKYGIKYKYINNHSKVILVDCGKDKYVVETSSNFNENPHIEQFSISNSEELYLFYLDVFLRLGVFE